MQRVSQAALAQALQRTQTWVSYRMTEKTSLSLPDVEEIARALGLPVERLLLGESPAQYRRRVS